MKRNQIAVISHYSKILRFVLYVWYQGTDCQNGEGKNTTTRMTETLRGAKNASCVLN